MVMRIKGNPGSRDFPGLKPLPKVGDVGDFDEATSAKLLKLGLAEVVETIRAVPEAPAIAAPKAPAIQAETKPASVVTRAKQSDKSPFNKES